jgi:translocator protein
MATDNSKNKLQFIPLIISILITLGIGISASFFTRPEIEGWYLSLHKPSFNPPNSLFAPVWTTLYILIGIAAYLVWNKKNDTKTYKNTEIIYIVQLLLNFSWSIVFFGMHQIFSAFIVIMLLWISIVLNMFYFAKFTKAAAWLLLPYLFWVSFASALNLGILLLNS